MVGLEARLFKRSHALRRDETANPLGNQGAERRQPPWNAPPRLPTDILKREVAKAPATCESLILASDERGANGASFVKFFRSRGCFSFLPRSIIIEL